MLCNAGLAALSLDMSHNGTFAANDHNHEAAASDGICYTHPELFQRNTLSREYQDLKHAIHFVSEGGLKDYFDGPFLIGLFGHSRGGVAATLNAIDRPEICALSTWSMVDDPDIFTREQKEKWRREEKVYFVDATDGTQLAVDIGYLDDLEENREFYFLRERVKELRVPHLIVHGKADMVVNFESAAILHQSESQLRDRRLVVLQTGHTFGIPYPASEPMIKPSSALRRATDETVSWFRRRLGGDQKT